MPDDKPDIQLIEPQIWEVLAKCSIKKFLTGIGLGLGIRKEDIRDNGKVIIGIRYDAKSKDIIMEHLL